MRRMQKCCNVLTEKTEKKMKNCMVCGKPLEYLTEPVEVKCYYCSKEEKGYFLCPEKHYVCEGCHGKGSFEAIKQIALNTKSKDPIVIADVMMQNPSIPMIGCEHALITAGAFLSALKNNGKIKIGDKQIIEAMERAKTISKSGYCGLSGTCGIACGLASAFSVILGANCSKDKEFSIVLHTHADATKVIASTAGPCCCKRFTRDVLSVGCNLAKIYFDIALPVFKSDISCSFSGKHSHCLKERCVYFEGGG
ncbi:hypothetical protein FP804_03925 [archaeon]|nr:hypothetical protein [archaeon]